MKSLFSVGDTVVCVDSKKQPLIEGKTYTIKGISVCKCGRVRVDVGDESDPHDCAGCYGNIGTCIYYQTRFVPLDTDHALENEIHEALKGQKIIV